MHQARSLCWVVICPSILLPYAIAAHDRCWGEGTHANETAAGRGEVYLICFYYDTKYHTRDTLVKKKS